MGPSFNLAFQCLELLSCKIGHVLLGSIPVAYGCETSYLPLYGKYILSSSISALSPLIVLLLLPGCRDLRIAPFIAQPYRVEISATIPCVAYSITALRSDTIAFTPPLLHDLPSPFLLSTSSLSSIKNSV